MICIQSCMILLVTSEASHVHQTQKHIMQHDLDIHLNTHSLSETIQSFWFYSVPNIVRLRAHTSKVAFLQALMTQWYWNWCRPSEQRCSMDSQFIFSAAIFQDVESVGHFSTYLSVKADFSQNVIAETWKNNIWRQSHFKKRYFIWFQLTHYPFLHEDIPFIFYIIKSRYFVLSHMCQNVPVQRFQK